MRLSSRSVLLPFAALLAGCDKAEPTRLAFVSPVPPSVVATDAQAPVQVAFVTDDGRIADHVADEVTIAIAGGGGGVVEGERTERATRGVATFHVNVRTAGPGYHFVANTPRFGASAASDPFTVLPGPATGLRIDEGAAPFLVGPRAVEVRVVDAAGNAVPTGSHVITLSSASILLGATQRTSVAGVAGFSDLQVCASGITTRLGSTVTELRATAPGLAERTTLLTLFAGPATGVTWVNSPANGVAGQKLPDLDLRVHDCGGNPVNGSLVLGWGACKPFLVNNPTGASLVATTSAPLGIGMTWAYTSGHNVAVDRPGTGYTMRVTCRQVQSPSVPIEVTSAVSAPFNVLP